MLYTLENELLKINVKTSGAELTSLFHKDTGQEYLWQADAAFWPRHAPILFPIVGKLKGDTYSYKGKTYQMSQHGFARDMAFELKESDRHKLVFELRENDSTLARYPFPFRLEVSYVLMGDTLTVKYTVENPAKEPMYFSIGGHPAFRCPVEEGSSFEDYALVFEKKETAGRWLLDNGLFNGRQEPVLNEQDTLPLQRNMFDQDALVFKYLASQWVSLQSKKHPYGLNFNFAGFPYLGIWAKPRADFICIEPWFGLADNIAQTGELTAKEGIIGLDPGKSFTCAYRVQPVQRI